MLTVHKILPQGKGLAASLRSRAPEVVLDWDTRQKSRFDAQDSSGRPLGIFLPRGTVVRGGDVLVAEDGSLLRVVARAETVMVVRSADAASPLPLLRAAYHLGNRHVALEVRADRLQLEPDHVLADMLRKMHLEVSETLAPFEPEGGAYAAHAAGAAAPHAHARAHDHGDHSGHVHGPDCGHDHH